MKVLILCDGYGKKKSVDAKAPNVLIELKPGFPVVDKILLDLATVGLKDAVLQTSVSSDMVQETLGEERKGVRLSYERTERTFENTAHILGRMDDDVLVVDSGMVTDLNLKKMLMKFTRSTAPVLVYTGVYEEAQRPVDPRSRTFFDRESYNVYGGVFCMRKDCDLTEFALGDELDTAFPMLADLGYLDFYSDDNFWDTLYTEDGKKRIFREWHNKTAKPWGYEKVRIITELYLLKELYIREGYQSSYHYHKKKDETMFVTRGTGYIEFEDRRAHFEKEDTIHVKPFERHTIVASTDTVLFEASTPFLEDTTRVKDYYPAR